MKPSTYHKSTTWSIYLWLFIWNKQLILCGYEISWKSWGPPPNMGGPCARGWWRWKTHVHNLLCLRGTWQLGCPQISVNMPWFQPCDQQSDRVWEGVEKKELSLTCASQSAQPNTCWDNKLDGRKRGKQKKIQPRTLSVMNLRIKINGSKKYQYIYNNNYYNDYYYWILLIMMQSFLLFL